ncbi:MAG: glycosyltransferase family 1 protein [Dehalococcoidia bacterium]
MRIAVDAISAGRGLGEAAGGMVVYMRDLLGSMARQLRDDEEVVVFVTPEKASLIMPDHARVRAVLCPLVPPGAGLRVLYEQTVYPWLIARQGVDVLLATSNVRPFLRRAPTVVVCQSLQYFLYPQAFGRLRRAYLRHAVPRSLRGASAVIAVSRFAAADLVALTGVPPEQVHPVLHGLSTRVRDSLASHDTDALSAVVRRYVPGGAPYLLALSTLYVFKNTRRIIEAFGRAVAEVQLPHRLVVAGEDADVTAAELASHAERIGLGGQVLFIGGVPHRDVSALLLGAEALLYPSLYETFGFPLLEAMAGGVPVVTSDRGAMREVAGDAALLVDPESVESIANAISRVVRDGELGRQLSVRGRARAAEFRWDRTAQETLAVLRTAAGRTP